MGDKSVGDWRSVALRVARIAPIDVTVKMGCWLILHVNLANGRLADTYPHVWSTLTVGLIV